MNLVYQYGLLPPRVEATRVSEQMHLGRQYYNKLIELLREYRISELALWQKHVPFAEAWAAYEGLCKELGEARTQLQEARSGQGRHDPNLAPAKGAIGQLKDQVFEALGAARKVLREAVAVPEIAAELYILKQAFEAKKREARGKSEVYWGTYQVLEQSAEAAAQATRKLTDDPPSFRRADANGVVAVGYNGKPVTPEDLFGEESTTCQIVATSHVPTPRMVRRGSRRVILRLRVGSDGRKPIFAEWPLLLHRPLPKDALIRTVQVLRLKVPEKPGQVFWKALFTLQVPDVPQVDGKRTLAVDLGWRRKDDQSLRLAYWRNSAGEEGEFLVPKSIPERLAKADSIRAIRDKELDQVRATLVALLQPQKESFTEELQKRVAQMHQWKAPKRFVSLLRYHGDELPNVAKTLLAEWAKRDLHLWKYESGMRHSALRHREDLVKVFVAHIADTYDRVVLEDFKITKLAKKPKPEEREEELTDKEAKADRTQRRQRHWLAPGQMRVIFKSTMAQRGIPIIEIPAANTTRRHHDCGTIIDQENPAELFHEHLDCPACGRTVVYDQDANAVRELLRLDAERVQDGGVQVSGPKPKRNRYQRRKDKKEAQG